MRQNMSFTNMDIDADVANNATFLWNKFVRETTVGAGCAARGSARNPVPWLAIPIQTCILCAAVSVHVPSRLWRYNKIVLFAMYFKPILATTVLCALFSVATCFNNPLILGADPYALAHNGTYYVMFTRQFDITIYAVTDLNDLDNVEPVRVWYVAQLRPGRWLVERLMIGPPFPRASRARIHRGHLRTSSIVRNPAMNRPVSTIIFFLLLATTTGALTLYIFRPVRAVHTRDDR